MYCIKIFLCVFEKRVFLQEQSFTRPWFIFNFRFLVASCSSDNKDNLIGGSHNSRFLLGLTKSSNAKYGHKRHQSMLLYEIESGIEVNVSNGLDASIPVHVNCKPLT